MRTITRNGKQYYIVDRDHLGVECLRALARLVAWFGIVALIVLAVGCDYCLWNAPKPYTCEVFANCVTDQGCSLRAGELELHRRCKMCAVSR